MRGAAQITRSNSPIFLAARASSLPPIEGNVTAAGRRRVGLLSRAQVSQPFVRGSLELALTLVDSVELQGLVIVGDR